MRRSLFALAAFAACAPGATPPPSCPPGMIAIPASSFNLGTAAGDPVREPNEGPAHRVRLEAYCLDVHEVTEGDLRAVYPDHPATGCTACPATAVDHAEAAGYCAARGLRLPTEAEFELAARGPAARSGESRRYPWGDSWPPAQPLVNGRDAALARLEPLWVPAADRGYDDRFAGIAPACALGRDRGGFCDLLGNAAEWCADRYAPGSYSFAPARDPQGPGEGRARVVRGGSFLDGPQALRPASRVALDESARSSLVGFRCARSATAEGNR